MTIWFIFIGRFSSSNHAAPVFLSVLSVQTQGGKYRFKSTTGATFHPVLRHATVKMGNIGITDGEDESNRE